jgi:outer membrane protein TolC
MPSPRRPSLAGAARAAVSALVAAQLGCATESLKHAPASPAEAWTAPPDSDYVQPLRATSASSAPAPAGVAFQPEPTQEQKDEQKQDAAPQNRVQLEVGHRYTLPELIDLAERHNPETREAWEKARQAALSIGLAESKYLPELAVSAIGGYQRTPLPMPTSVIPSGVVTFVTAEVVPVLAAKWLLFDFGVRDAELHEARAKSFAANVTFTAAHEKLVFSVTKGYFALSEARAGVGVAQFAVQNAVKTQEISEAKRTQGVATVVEVAQAQRATAQARYELVKAQGGERTAYGALVGTMGIDPNGTLEVADGSDRPLPVAPAEDVHALIERALTSRPDVLAAFGKVRAAEANLEKARAAYGPKLDVSGQLYEMIGWWSVDSPFFRLTKPGGNAMLGLNWPLFDGGARGVNVATAHSEVAAARAALDGARAKAVEDVTRAYDQLQASLAEYRAAGEVEAAARTALEAAVEAYRSGVGPVTDALSAANAASKSRLQLEEARSGVLTSAAELAFALGSATRR